MAQLSTPRMLTALAVSFSFAGLAVAAPAPADSASSATPAATMRERLAGPVSLSLREQSLRAAVDALRKAAKIDIVLDAMTIQQQLGFTPDQPPVAVNIDLQGVPLRMAFRRVLDPYGLDYVVVGETVIVTTEDAAAVRQLRQHVGVNLDRVELAAALKQLGRDAGVNLVLDSRAEKEGSLKVSLQVEDIPLETAVRLLAETAGLKAVRAGKVLFVTNKAAAEEMRREAPVPLPRVLRLEDLSDSAIALPAPPPLIVSGPPPGIPPVVPPAAGQP